MNKADSIMSNEKLATVISEVAETAGYLWEKGWAERNGGNITVNVTDCVDESIKNADPISEPKAIGITLPHLKGCYFLCKGTNRRMRDLARKPLDNSSIIRICDDCASYVIVAEKPVMPTSELPSHLAVHNMMIAEGTGGKACIHTHPTDLVAMSHHKPFLEEGVLGTLLWSMIPETRAFCPRGLGIIPYELPGSIKLADATIEGLKKHDVVLWEKHGVFSIGPDVLAAFDYIDVLSKAAQIYISAKNMGFVPDGMSQEQMDELKEAFNL